MLSQVLSEYSLFGAVIEKAFTSTEYYRNLPQSTAEEVKSSFQALKSGTKAGNTPDKKYCSSHGTRLARYQKTIVERAVELYAMKCKTFALFVDDHNNTLLCKSWGAMQSVCSISELVSGWAPQVSTPMSASASADPPSAKRRWFVLQDFSEKDASKPAQALQNSFERCWKCRSAVGYTTSQEASLHVQKHLKRMSTKGVSNLDPGDSIVDYNQLRLEVWTKGCADILSKACQEAQQLYDSTKELSDGVMNEDGQMSKLYTLPRSLLDAFRQLVVFYFAVERAMFYTQETLKDDAIKIGDQNLGSIDGVPFSKNDLHVISMFGRGVSQALATARKELCSMAKSPEPSNAFERLSLSPEYVCGWYMRRLIVKPLQNHMTVSDMYREYLSTIVSDIQTINLIMC